LQHLSNHSFRHRFVTLNIAKAIKKISESGSFINVLTVAADACRKMTMHASNESLSRYIHLASEHNQEFDETTNDMPMQTRLRIKKLKTIAESVRSGQLNDKEAIGAFLSTLDEFKS
jgi:hypothetical protein